MERRTLLQTLAASSAALFLTNIHATTDERTMSTTNTTETWEKTFPENDRVAHRKVRFKNRYGITLAGDLYRPKDAAASERLPAVAVCGPFGAVKEQASGLYAQTLATRGFVALAFDASFTGESGPEAMRNVASPDINTEDFSAAVDFLETLDGVDAKRLGLLGICGFGGFALNAAAMDTRVSAVVASTMYDMTRVTARGYYDAMDEAERIAMLEALNAQRTKDVRTGTFAPAPGLPEKLAGNEPEFVKDYWNYYKTPRGFHPRSINSNGHWNATSALSLANMPILAYAGSMRAKALLVHGERAHSRYFSEDAFKRLDPARAKLLIVPGASHTDLYDQVEKIPFDAIAAHLGAR